jgi:hypothetical protein
LIQFFCHKIELQISVLEKVTSNKTSQIETVCCFYGVLSSWISITISE